MSISNSSSDESLQPTDDTLSFTCCGLEAPAMTDATKGLLRSQENAKLSSGRSLFSQNSASPQLVSNHPEDTNLARKLLRVPGYSCALR